MEIVINNLQKKIPLQTNQIKKIVLRILELQNIDHAVLSIVFVTSQKIRALNKKYLNRTYSTDVLAFDLSEEFFLSTGSKLLKKSTVIGDVFISTDAIRQNSNKYQTSISQELVLYVIHGILHLMGYDDHRDADIRKMRQKEEELLKQVHLLIPKTTKAK